MRPIICLLTCLAAADLWAGEPAGLLLYKVWENGLEPYVSRILVTSRHVRLDEGQDLGDFTLFDREQGAIRNVSVADESILLMRPAGGMPKPATELKLSEKTEIDPDAPRVAGEQPQQLWLYTNGELCRKLVTVQGVMTDAVAGLAEFRRTLAKIQLTTRPVESSLCEQSEFLYASDRSLGFGLPLRDSYAGKNQVLLDFDQQYDVAPELFLVPASYREISMPGLSSE